MCFMMATLCSKGCFPEFLAADRPDGLLFGLLNVLVSLCLGFAALTHEHHKQHHHRHYQNGQEKSHSSYIRVFLVLLCQPSSSFAINKKLSLQGWCLNTNWRLADQPWSFDPPVV